MPVMGAVMDDTAEIPGLELESLSTAEKCTSMTVPAVETIMHIVCDGNVEPS